MLIIGKNGFSKLLLGREININQVKTKTFTVAANIPNSSILPGDLLITTEKAQVYTTPSKTGSVSEYEGKIAGIALATNVKVDPLFPQSSTEVGFEKGQQGACVVEGEVAVKLTGAAPVEGAKVYYSLADAAFTATAGSNLECPGFKFSGITEGNLTVVNKVY